LSRTVHDVSKNHKPALIECVRYCAPEKLGLIPQTKYDSKSEVYSFGILLWEIAEEKTPEKYREPFSPTCSLPKEYQDIAKKGIFIIYIKSFVSLFYNINFGKYLYFSC
jgi:serine/threonine protein kinase